MGIDMYGPHHHTHKLYPLQDLVLALLSAGGSRLCLTGGTVMARFMFQHRYSDYLEFFMNADKGFEQEADRLIKRITDVFNDTDVAIRQPSHRRVHVHLEGTRLRIDMVNNVAPHLGGLLLHPQYDLMDNPYNMLTDTVSAMNRGQAEDVADIIWLCRNIPFNWPDVIHEAMQRASWVNEVALLEKLHSFDAEILLREVAWTTIPDVHRSEPDLS